MPIESRGFADTLAATSSGPSAAPGSWREGAYATHPDEVKEDSGIYDDDSSITGPRSSTMHLGRRPKKIR
jgi:hypothetical protein